ncbi:CotY/CotZ family spore coat protein [Virgibacillus ihumii]|uniref:CotY/CotZ family spore coat protein n=1 Tax=Virgibacillus ihumii TaxID=2686091 RepID=UPI00157CBF60|nr:CotY/CotZ family spore coat protein [Virgibacillus ihumii]
MGCGKDFDTGNCVCDILKEIVDAQNDVVENCCDTSCERSISDLLGETDNGNGLDTVPLILYCKDGCKPFKGFGACPTNGNGNGGGHVEASFFFRVKKVTDDCCAVIELLRDDEAEGNPHDPFCSDVEDLSATGICLTVDLSCFCHVTCLPAIQAL